MDNLRFNEKNTIATINTTTEDLCRCSECGYFKVEHGSAAKCPYCHEFGGRIHENQVINLKTIYRKELGYDL